MDKCFEFSSLLALTVAIIFQADLKLRVLIQKYQIEILAWKISSSRTPHD